MQNWVLLPPEKAIALSEPESGSQQKFQPEVPVEEADMSVRFIRLAQDGPEPSIATRATTNAAAGNAHIIVRLAMVPSSLSRLPYSGSFFSSL
jgi:hypothetical protein